MTRVSLATVPFLLIGALSARAADPPPSQPNANSCEATVGIFLRDAPTRRGMCLDLTGADAGLAVELAESCEMTVYRVEKDAAGVARARGMATERGLLPPRLRVELGPLEALAYPDYCAALILADSLDGPAPPAEIWRVLRPAGSLFVRQPVAAVRAALQAAGVKDVEPQEAPAGWTRAVRPPLQGAADWMHYHYDPSNNRYSPDTNIRPPFRVLWYGQPTRTRGKLWLGQGLAAAGRVFLADVSPTDPRCASLTALDAYTGIVLWERRVGGPRFAWERGTAADYRGYFVAATNLPGKVLAGQMAIGDDGRIYLADSTRCLVIDAAGGADVASLTAPPPCHPENHWLFVARIGPTLIGHAAAPDDPSKRPRAEADSVSGKGGPPAVFALDAASGKPRWVRGGKDADELGGSFGPPLAIGADRVFLRAGADLFALETATGKTAWVERGVEKDGEQTWWEGVVHAGRFHLYKFNMRLYGAKKSQPTLVFAAADGKRLEEEQVDGKPLFVSSQQKLNRLPSGVVNHTGAGTATGCAYETAAGQVVFGRNGYSMEGRGGFTNYGGFRAACKVGALPANGLVQVLPNWGCQCAVFSATLALQPGRAEEKLDLKAPPLVEQVGQLAAGADLPATARDWPTFRADTARSARTAQDLSAPLKQVWQTSIPGEPTAPIAIGDLVWIGSSDERVHALDAATGKTRWTFSATGSIQAAPVYWNGRILLGCDDGWVYCLAAADGQLLWRLRAAPAARKQMAFGRVVSAWPVRQGLAVEDGKVYFTAGCVPSQGIVTGAADAATGQLLWRVEPARGFVPCGSLTLADDRVFVPGEVDAPSIQLSRTDGSPLKAGPGRSHFAEVSYVVRSPADGELPPDRKGFVVHGGGGVSRGYGENFVLGGRPYYLLTVPWDGQALPGRNAAGDSFGDGASFPPVFGAARVYFRQGGAVVAVARSRLAEMLAIRERTGKERDSLLAWKSADLPCGKPDWLVLATSADNDTKTTLLAGGPAGVAALDAATGKVRWSAPLPASTQAPAVARGRVFLTSSDGMVRCLAGTPEP